MVATGAGTRVDVTLKLPQLQNFCKRDPSGYRGDYDAQIRRLESELGILVLQPNVEPSPRLIELIQFAAAVSSSSYKGKESDKIASMLTNVLMGSFNASTSSEPSVKNVGIMPTAALHLHRDVRKTCVSALILMRNKGAVEPLDLMELFFRIMSVVPDKALRELLYRHIVNDIRNINKKGKRDDKVNRSVMSFLHRVVVTHGSAESTEETATDIAAKRATDMVCELYRRRVWTDERAVAILASAVQSKNTTVMARAIRFFLGIEEKMAQDEKEQEEGETNKNKDIDYHSHSKKTAARQRHVERQMKNLQKFKKKKEQAEWMDISPEEDKGVEACKKLFPAIEVLRDPQGLAESVFKRLRSSGSIKYELKLLMMNFVTRLVGNHELLLLQLYPFLQKYMGGQQRDVTAVLAFCVQACHENVPPDEVYGILKTIAHNFITERCSEEQMAVGINAARAICARVPSVLSVEESKESSSSTVMDIEAFARDLAAYANHRDRSVSIAGKAWTNFIREVHPGLLQGKSRGLLGSALHKNGEKPLRYGERKVSYGVEGADLLYAYEAKMAAKKRKNLDAYPDESEEEEEEEEEEIFEPEDKEEDIESDVEAPELINLDRNVESGEDDVGSDVEDEEVSDSGEPVLDLSKMTREEREKLKQQVSSSRVFTTKDFIRMRKLVEQEQRLKRDPREAARRKRALARGEDVQDLSDDESESEDERIHIPGAVNPSELMAEANRKRLSKAERLEKVIAGRTGFESKHREGGSTNIEKKRKKNFLMSKFSQDARSKGRGKGHLQEKQKGAKQIYKHEAKKRRRKL